MQHLREGLGGGLEVKAFAWCIVVGVDGLTETAGREGCEVGFARDEASHSTDRILDAALLPGRVGIAEEGLDREAAQRQVMSKLGAVVEGDGLTQALWQDREQANEMASDATRNFAGEADAEQQARGALMHGQDRLTIFGEHHQVGFPMTGGAAVVGLDGPICQRNTAFNEACGTAALLAAVTALALGARQVASPAEVRGASDLGVNEPVDGLVGDHLAAVFAGQPAGDLLGRPAPTQAFQHRAAQAGLPFEAYARPAPRSHLLLGIGGFVADLNAPIAVQLPRDR